MQQTVIKKCGWGPGNSMPQIQVSGMELPGPQPHFLITVCCIRIFNKNEILLKNKHANKNL